MTASDQSSQSDAPTVTVEEHEGVTLLKLVGEHDAMTTQMILSEISRAGRDGGVAVSLADAKFIDSTVLHALVIGDRMLRTFGRRLAIYSEPGTPPDRVIELSSLNHLLLLGDTVAEAIEFAKQAAGSTPAA